MNMRSRVFVLFCLLLAVAGKGEGAVYRVKPGGPYPNLQLVSGKLRPGDVVEVAGNATYLGGVSFSRNGTPNEPITIRGIRVLGKRPVIEAVANMPGWAIVRFMGSHYRFEGFEITAGGKPLGSRGIYNVGDDVTIKDCLVHDCPFNGIAGSDASGSMTLAGVEIHHCGSGDRMHQIYVGSSNSLYPKAVFRMEFCYLHDGTGGNNVKSRVTRNEIYYNWIEGAFYHELDLIGADPSGQKGTPKLREDSDVVGNVLLKLPSTHAFVANLGGDGTGISNGRYRFVNNTIILPAGPAGNGEVFRLKNAVQSIEMHNNVFYRPQNQPIKILSDNQLAPGTQYGKAGDNNWLSNGARPGFWTNTHRLNSSDLANPDQFDFHPVGALLSSRSVYPTRSPAGLEFPMPLQSPAFSPPNREASSGLPPRRAAALTVGGL